MGPDRRVPAPCGAGPRPRPLSDGREISAPHRLSARQVMSSNWDRPRANSRTAASTRAIQWSARRRALFGEETFEAVLPELARLRVLGFGDAIGVEEEKVARAHLGLAHHHLHGLEQADRQAAARQRFNRAAGAADERGEVAAAAIFDFARARIVRGVDERGEELRRRCCSRGTRSPSGSPPAGRGSHAG